MQALQGPMSKLREKHKGNSQKINQEMMKFYKEHKVNPFAGCWPILIQIPIFLGMFWMLRSASELYGQNFLWANDLSEQDNVSTIQGFSLNVLPIFMVATQWFQMRLNPMQMGPQMSEAQRINAKMMRFMPFMFLVFLYFFSSALVLYWTIQNLMTILQTLITKTNHEIPEQVAEVASKSRKDLEGSAPSISVDISDDERRYRNLLGLKIKGSINLKKLEENYKTRMLNYEEKKLAQMSASKRRISMEKKDRLQEAYDYLKDMSTSNLDIYHLKPSNFSLCQDTVNGLQRKDTKQQFDAKRGKIFSVISKEITLAARDSGKDAEFNPRLRTLITKAKQANMPADNIDRAIKKGTGELGGVIIEELLYEGYAPGGVGLMVEVTTDNKNRSASEVRSTFSKGGGNLAGAGALAFNFKRKGQFPRFERKN